MLQKKNISFILMILLMLMPNLMFGSSINISGTQNILNAVKLALYAVAGVTITVLIAYVSFKVMHQGRPIDEMTKVIVGGGLLASATAIGGVFAGFIESQG